MMKMVKSDACLATHLQQADWIIVWMLVEACRSYAPEDDSSTAFFVNQGLVGHLGNAPLQPDLDLLVY